MKAAFAVAALALGSLLAGCGSNGWLANHEQSCNKYPPSDERVACEKRFKEILAASEKQRTQERQNATRESEPEGSSDPKKGLCFKRQSTGETVCPN
jgi:hypothetical protein